MGGLYSSLPLPDSITLREMGTDILTPSVSQVQGAGVDYAVDLMPTVRTFRDAFRLGQPELQESGLDPDFPFTGAPPTQRRVLQPDEAKQYEVPGRLKFTAPIHETTAKRLHDLHLDQLKRDDILERNEGTEFGAGAVARWLPRLALAALDPINLATGFIPVLGAARFAELAAAGATSALGRGVVRLGVGLEDTFGQTALGRAALRVGVGGVEGGVATAATQPLEYALSKTELNDFSMSQALTNIAFGTVLGGGFHVAFGRNPRLTAVGSEGRDTLLRGAVGQHLDDREINVYSALEAHEIANHQTELLRWTRQQELHDQRANAAIEALAPGEKQAARAAGARTRLDDLAGQAEALRTEIAGARGVAGEAAARAAAAAAPDPVTAARIAAVERELAGTIPAARRAALEGERRILTEGAAAPRQEDLLAAARSEAEAQGLTRELGRVSARQRGAEGIAARAEAQAGTVGEAYDVASARLASQQNLLQALTERSLRRFAAAAGAEVEPEILQAMAARVLRDRAEVPRVMRELAAAGERPAAIIDRAAIRAEVAAAGGDVARAAGTILGTIRRELGRGSTVEHVVGDRRVPIAANERGLLVDAQGRRWGLVQLTSAGGHLEIRPPRVVSELPPLGPIPLDGMAPLQQAGRRVANDLKSVSRETPMPRDPAAAAEAERLAQKVPANTDEAAAARMLADVKADVAAMRAEGKLTPEHEAIWRKFEQDNLNDEGFVKAVAASGECVLRVLT